MKLLAVDTVTEYCSTALYLDGELTFREALANQSHTEVILPMVEDLLTQAGIKLKHLDVIAFDRGPGSFTGLRIGAGITQGLALGASLPVIPVSSLQILAQGCYQRYQMQNVLACIDARQGETYWGCFRLRSGIMTLEGSEQLGYPDTVSTLSDVTYFGVGTGFATFETELRDNPNVTLSDYNNNSYPLARDIINIAAHAWERQEYVDGSTALPVYLRDKVATPKMP